MSSKHVLYPTYFSWKGKITDCRKHYMLNLTIKQLQVETRTGLLGLGNVWEPQVPRASQLQLQDSGHLQHRISEPALVVAQVQPQYSHGLMLWDATEIWRKNESKSYHFSPLQLSKSSEIQLWNRNTTRRHFTIQHLFFLQTIRFHRSVHEAVNTYIKISFAFIMQCARKQIERSLPIAPVFIPVSVYSPLEGSNLHNITQEK